MTKKQHNPTVRHTIGLVLVLGALLLVFHAVGVILNTEKRLIIGSFESFTEKSFYQEPSNIPKSNPGKLLRAQKLYSTPDGIDGWRVMYTSTDRKGSDIVVTGLVAAPSNMKSNQKHTIVSWGHPTTGIAKQCAPSVGIDPFDSIEGLRDLVKHGYIVAATDYSGMGMAGPPSFLIGDTEGRNVIDAVRATQDLLPQNASSDVFFWGHSQGGHASLFAEQTADTYAPELTVKGVATAAPATKLGDLLQADAGDVSGVTIGSYAMNAYSQEYDQNLNTILTKAGVEATPGMARYCLIGQNSKLHEIATPLIGDYFTKDPSTVEPWATILSDNTPGKSKIKSPLFVAQGQTDTLVHPEITKEFVDEQKLFGANVTYLSIPNTGHGMVALKAMPDVISWMNQYK